MRLIDFQGSLFAFPPSNDYVVYETGSPDIPDKITEVRTCYEDAESRLLQRLLQRVPSAQYQTPVSAMSTGARTNVVTPSVIAPDGRIVWSRGQQYARIKVQGDRKELTTVGTVEVAQAVSPFTMGLAIDIEPAEVFVLQTLSNTAQLVALDNAGVLNLFDAKRIRFSDRLEAIVCPETWVLQFLLNSKKIGKAVHLSDSRAFRSALVPARLEAGGLTVMGDRYPLASVPPLELRQAVIRAAVELLASAGVSSKEVPRKALEQLEPEAHHIARVINRGGYCSSPNTEEKR